MYISKFQRLGWVLCSWENSYYWIRIRFLDYSCTVWWCKEYLYAVTVKTWQKQEATAQSISAARESINNSNDNTPPHNEFNDILDEICDILCCNCIWAQAERLRCDKRLRDWNCKAEKPGLWAWLLPKAFLRNEYLWDDFCTLLG